MLVTKMAKNVTNIVKLLSTNFVSNIDVIAEAFKIQNMQSVNILPYDYTIRGR